METKTAEREVVIEYERIQFIRKRAKTDSFYCERCGTVADFVRVAYAAALFEMDVDNIIAFANGNGCHYREEYGDVSLCLSSFLARIKANAISSDTKLMGE